MNYYNITTRILSLGRLKEKVNYNFNSIEEPRIVIESMREDFEEGDCETPRISYKDINTPDNEMVVDLKHSQTAKIPRIGTEIALPERSQTISAEKTGSEIRFTEITEDELDTFTNMFKDRLKLPTFYKDQFNTISSLPTIPTEAIECLNLDQPKKQKLTSKTVIFDLDETLVRVMTDEMLANTKMLYKADIKRTSYVTTKTGKVIEVNVVVRPYAIEMLNKLAPYYEIIIFTAATKSYGDAIMDLLDPNNTLIDHRLYRNNCMKLNEVYIKDLRVLNRDLNEVVIVDNNIVSFSHQIENGIVIPAFEGSKSDSQLAELWIFLRQSAYAKDIRIPIASKYNLKFFYQMHNRIKETTN